MQTSCCLSTTNVRRLTHNRTWVRVRTNKNNSHGLCWFHRTTSVLRTANTGVCCHSTWQWKTATMYMYVTLTPQTTQRLDGLQTLWTELIFNEWQYHYKQHPKDTGSSLSGSQHIGQFSQPAIHFMTLMGLNRKYIYTKDINNNKLDHTFSKLN